MEDGEILDKLRDSKLLMGDLHPGIEHVLRPFKLHR
jgi:hypothetical protein